MFMFHQMHLKKCYVFSLSMVAGMFHMIDYSLPCVPLENISHKGYINTWGVEGADIIFTLKRRYCPLDLNQSPLDHKGHGANYP